MVGGKNGEWRGSNRNGFAANEGDRVYAVVNAVVEDVYDDELRGKCILLKEENGTQYLYTGLSQKLTVKASDKVTAGDVIGSVGPVIDVERNDKPHLHMEVIKDGVRIDIESLLS